MVGLTEEGDDNFHLGNDLKSTSLSEAVQLKCYETNRPEVIEPTNILHRIMEPMAYILHVNDCRVVITN